MSGISLDVDLITLRNITACNPDNSLVSTGYVLVTSTNGEAYWQGSLSSFSISTLNTNNIDMNNGTINGVALISSPHITINTSTGIDVIGGPLNIDNTNLNVNNGDINVNSGDIYISSGGFLSTNVINMTDGIINGISTINSSTLNINTNIFTISSSSTFINSGTLVLQSSIIIDITSSNVIVNNGNIEVNNGNIYISSGFLSTNNINVDCGIINDVSTVTFCSLYPDNALVPNNAINSYSEYQLAFVSSIANNNNTTDIGFTLYTVPAGVDFMLFEMVGSGSYANQSGNLAGPGGYMKGIINLKPFVGQTLNIYPGYNLNTRASYINVNSGPLLAVAGAGGAGGYCIPNTFAISTGFNGGEGGGGSFDINGVASGGNGFSPYSTLVSGGGGGSIIGDTLGGNAGILSTQYLANGWGINGGPGSNTSGNTDVNGGSSYSYGFDYYGQGGDGYTGGGGGAFYMRSTSGSFSNGNLSTCAGGGGGSSYYNKNYVTLISSYSGFNFSTNAALTNISTGYGLSFKAGYINISTFTGFIGLEVTQDLLVDGCISTNCIQMNNGEISGLNIIANGFSTLGSLNVTNTLNASSISTNLIQMSSGQISGLSTITNGFSTIGSVNVTSSLNASSINSEYIEMNGGTINNVSNINIYNNSNISLSNSQNTLNISTSYGGIQFTSNNGVFQFTNPTTYNTNNYASLFAGSSGSLDITAAGIINTGVTIQSYGSLGPTFQFDNSGNFLMPSGVNSYISSNQIQMTNGIINGVSSIIMSGSNIQGVKNIDMINGQITNLSTISSGFTTLGSITVTSTLYASSISSPMVNTSTVTLNGKNLNTIGNILYFNGAEIVTGSNISSISSLYWREAGNGALYNTNIGVGPDYYLVGVGTSTLNATLDVSGSIRADSYISTNQIQMNNGQITGLSTVANGFTTLGSLSVTSSLNASSINTNNVNTSSLETNSLFASTISSNYIIMANGQISGLSSITGLSSINGKPFDAGNDVYWISTNGIISSNTSLPLVVGTSFSASTISTNLIQMNNGIINGLNIISSYTNNGLLIESGCAGGGQLSLLGCPFDIPYINTDSLNNMYLQTPNQAIYIQSSNLIFNASNIDMNNNNISNINTLSFNILGQISGLNTVMNGFSTLGSLDVTSTLYASTISSNLIQMTYGDISGLSSITGLSSINGKPFDAGNDIYWVSTLTGSISSNTGLPLVVGTSLNASSILTNNISMTLGQITGISTINNNGGNISFGNDSNISTISLNASTITMNSNVYISSQFTQQITYILSTSGTSTIVAPSWATRLVFEVFGAGGEVGGSGTGNDQTGNGIGGSGGTGGYIKGMIDIQPNTSFGINVGSNCQSTSYSFISTISGNFITIAGSGGGGGGGGSTITQVGGFGGGGGGLIWNSIIGGYYSPGINGGKGIDYSPTFGGSFGGNGGSNTGGSGGACGTTPDLSGCYYGSTGILYYGGGGGGANSIIGGNSGGCGGMAHADGGSGGGGGSGYYGGGGGGYSYSGNYPYEGGAGGGGGGGSSYIKLGTQLISSFDGSTIVGNSYISTLIVPSGFGREGQSGYVSVTFLASNYSLVTNQGILISSNSAYSNTIINTDIITIGSNDTSLINIQAGRNINVGSNASNITLGNPNITGTEIDIYASTITLGGGNCFNLNLGNNETAASSFIYGGTLDIGSGNTNTISIGNSYNTQLITITSDVNIINSNNTIQYVNAADTRRGFTISSIGTDMHFNMGFYSPSTNIIYPSLQGYSSIISAGIVSTFSSQRVYINPDGGDISLGNYFGTDLITLNSQNTVQYVTNNDIFTGFTISSINTLRNLTLGFDNNNPSIQSYSTTGVPQALYINPNGGNVYMGDADSPVFTTILGGTIDLLTSDGGVINMEASTGTTSTIKMNASSILMNNTSGNIILGNTGVSSFSTNIFGGNINIGTGNNTFVLNLGTNQVNNHQTNIYGTDISIGGGNSTKITMTAPIITMSASTFTTNGGTNAGQVYDIINNKPSGTISTLTYSGDMQQQMAQFSTINAGLYILNLQLIFTSTSANTDATTPFKWGITDINYSTINNYANSVVKNSITIPSSDNDNDRFFYNNSIYCTLSSYTGYNAAVGIGLIGGGSWNAGANGNRLVAIEIIRMC